MGADNTKPKLFEVKKNYCWLTGYPVTPADWNRDREAEYIRKRNTKHKKEHGKVQVETGG